MIRTEGRVKFLIWWADMFAKTNNSHFGKSTVKLLHALAIESSLHTDLSRNFGKVPVAGRSTSGKSSVQDRFRGEGDYSPYVPWYIGVLDAQCEAQQSLGFPTFILKVKAWIFHFLLLTRAQLLVVISTINQLTTCNQSVAAHFSAEENWNCHHRESSGLATRGYGFRILTVRSINLSGLGNQGKKAIVTSAVFYLRSQMLDFYKHRGRSHNQPMISPKVSQNNMGEGGPHARLTGGISYARSTPILPCLSFSFGLRERALLNITLSNMFWKGPWLESLIGRETTTYSRGVR